MGSAIMNAGALVVVTSEIVGYKSGLALSREQMVELLHDAPQYQRLLQHPDDMLLRVRSVEFEELITQLLHRVGVADTPEAGPPLLVAPYIGDEIRLPMAMELAQLFTEHIHKEIEEKKNTGDKTIDPIPFLKLARRKYWILGEQIAYKMVKDFADYMDRNPFSISRSIEWEDATELTDLFESESLSTPHGEFFDQRFINYLYKNFDDIDKINWRKFEELAGEYLERLGFKVDMGPGRNDGSIDIRAWADEPSARQPPTILVQCKREKKKIGKVVVKALWADMQHENTQSGLVVTSKALSPGAEEVCKARKYPIEQANRSTLQQWIQAMRTPGSGVFLSE